MEKITWKYTTIISYTSVFLKIKGNTGNLIYFLLLASHVIISPFSRFLVRRFLQNVNVIDYF